jgi:hypothetical protein
MTELGEIFAELGISHYLHDFLEQGFDTWETILDITESDFDALGVKLGHRRKLQRKIANSRGVSSDRALASPRHTPSDDPTSDEQKLSGSKVDGKDTNGAAHGAKRKYRRHPKPDDNAPERPPSAYVIFSNKMREELKGRNLSFTEIAKLVGENWQNLSPAEKEPYEQQAFSAKEKYNNELSEYKKTSNYREYSQYLAEFKARQSNQHQASEDVSKRPKLEPHASTASSGTASSTASQYDGDASAGVRVRLETNNSNGQWHGEHRSPQFSNMPKVAVALGGAKNQTAPQATSPTVLPGYRESIFGVNQQGLPWRDNQREENGVQSLPGIASVNGRRSSYSEHSLRNGQGHPPQLLTSESTNSTSSTSYFTPRTPMEPPLERALPIPSMYSQKSSGNFENQLPPLRPPSLSPQSSLANQQSPNGIHPIIDFPTSIPPLRGYPANTSQQAAQNGHNDTRIREFMSSNPSDDNLDPVSALLRAGEIVNRNSRERPST